MNRRDFLKCGAAALVAAALPSPALFHAFAAPVEAVPRRKGARVVVLGGGFGGATAARYLRRLDPKGKVEVVLVERNPAFVSCPMSNLVVAGLRPLKEVTFSYGKLAKGGVKVLRGEAVSVDPEARKVFLADGSFLSWDRLVVAPGIDFRFDAVAGLDEAAQAAMPHAYKAGPQTERLREMASSLPEGGTFLLTVPEAPYRCPPGPYERASLVAWALKRAGGGRKIVVLDANPDVVAKGKLFKQAWSDLYPGVLEYVPEAELASVDGARLAVTAGGKEYAGQAVNLVPPQKAGKLAFDAGLVPEGKRWAPVKPLTYESTLREGVHVIGDAVDPATAGPMPKSGFVANGMGKAAAAACLALLAGKEPPPPSLSNTCYSLVSDREAIWVSALYAWDGKAGKMAAVKESMALSPARSARYAAHGEDWARSIWSDTLG